jgi:transposase
MPRIEGTKTIFDGPHGSLAVPVHDEITRKLFMLKEGQCEGLGAAAAARKYGYSKQRYYQLLPALNRDGALALAGGKRGPKTNYRRTDEVIRQVIRYRFLDPDASAQVIAQKLTQTGWPIRIRSVERILLDYGLQKKTTHVSTRRPPND